MSVRALQEYTRFSKYAKYLPEKKRRETWEEQVSRVFDMHKEKLGPKLCELLKDDLEFAEKMVRKKRVLGSQRALQFGGKPILKNNSKLYNCTMTHCDRARFFQEGIYLLLCGCVLPDTKVLTENGIKEIKDILEGENVWSFNKNTGEIELKRVIKTHNVHVPVEENIKISGLYGNFTTSKKHPVLTLREGKWEYVPSDSISLGDIIQKASFQNSSSEFNKEAYFVGAFLGDGSSNLTKYDSRRIRLNGDNEEVVKAFAELIEDLSGEKTKYKEDNRSFYSVPMWMVEKTLNKENYLARNWTSLVGDLPSSKAKHIKIPKWIKEQYNKDVFLSFLAGLIDTDGYVQIGKADISTISKELVKEICSESTKYGIYPWVSTITKDSYCSTGFTPKNDLYRITFSINDLAESASFFKHNKKRDEINQFLCSKNKSHKRLVIPREKIDEEAKYLGLDSHTAWHFRKQIEENGTCYASYYTSREKCFYHLLKYDMVIDIECNLDITEDFKDLSVEDNNSYICGEGSYYVLHNCGIGFSVQRHHVDKLPNIKTPKEEEKTFVIPDSIEGWSDALGVLLSSFFVGNTVPFPEYQGVTVKFDYSQIRPEGAPISSGGKAPGPNGLEAALIKIDKLLRHCCKLGNKLEPIHAYDIMMHSSDAVLSGGIRRSASICLFSPDDEEMAKAKTGSWHIENPQRGRSNNSVILVRDETTKDQFMKFIEYNKEFGEPGFVWVEDKETVVNPCVEIGSIPRLPLNDELREELKEEIENQGNNEFLSGWQFCNLSEINAKKTRTEEEFLDSCRAASIIGTIQASYDKFEYLGRTTEEIVRMEALLGVSMTGMADNPDIAFSPSLQRKGAKLILDVNERIANIIGINPCARACCVKPAGCRQPTGLVNTDSGLLTLGEIMKDHDVRERWDNLNESINLKQDFNNLSTCDKTYLNGLSDVCKIKLNYGYELISTPEHKWFVDYAVDRSKKNKRREINAFKRTDSLEEGDVINFDIGNYNKVTSSKLVANYRFSTFCKNMDKLNQIKYPSSLNEDISWLLGYLWGDGSMSISGRRLRWIDQNIFNLEKVQRILKNEFGLDSNIIPCKNKDAYTLDIGNSILWDFFEVNGIFKYDDKKEICLIPKVVRSSSANDILAFISGILDADGGVYENRTKSGANTIVFTTASEEFSKHFQEVAASVGLLFGRSLNSKGQNLQKEKKMFLMTLSPHVKHSCFEIFKKNSCKLSRVSHKTWHHENAKGSIGIVGKVLSVEMMEHKELTCDIESSSSWYYAGAVKTHNSTSCVLGTASGIHPHHAKRYFRRVQANKLEAPLQYFKEHNPDAIEESVWSTNNTDVVITFLCEVPDGAKIKNQVDAISLLENVKLTQQNWVEYGTRHDKTIYPTLRHNVSNTISIKPHEWKDVANHIYKNKKWYAGISMLPMSGDKDYPQAPFTAVLTTNEMIREYGDGSLFASGLIVDGLRVFDGNLWAASDCVLGIGEIITTGPLRKKIERDCEVNGTKWKEEGLSPDSPDKLLLAWLKHNVKNYKEKLDWVRRAKQFANRYFDGDSRKMTYCLKDVSNWKKWLDLQRTYVDVDWSSCYEDEYGNLGNYGGGAGDACAGGMCEYGDLGYTIRDSLSKKD